MTSLYSHDIFWFYLSGLSNRIIEKYLVNGDWSQSMDTPEAVEGTCDQRRLIRQRGCIG